MYTLTLLKFRSQQLLTQISCPLNQLSKLQNKDNQIDRSLGLRHNNLKELTTKNLAQRFSDLQIVVGKKTVNPYHVILKSNLI